MDDHGQKAAVRFDRWAASYGDDRLKGWFHFYQRLALSELRIEDGPGFLEVGCATGWAVREAALRLTSGLACGIDISPKMVEKAAAQSQHVPNVEFRIANAEFIPYPDESFYSVLCTNSFHHYENPLNALREIRRVTKKGGRLALIDSARDVSFAIWLQDRWRRYLEKSHVQYHTTSEILDLLKAAEWNVIGELTKIKAFMSHGKTFTGLAFALCEK